jgi:hypothetical protein
MPSAHDLAKQLDLTYEAGKTALANLERLGVIASRVVEMQTYNQELQESLGNVLTLARLKWGNLDADANKVFEQAETLLAHGRCAALSGDQRVDRKAVQSGQDDRPVRNRGRAAEDPSHIPSISPDWRSR